MVNNDKSDAVSTILGVFGITASLQDIQQIVSIILLVLSIINILWVLFSRIYQHMKNKQYKEIGDDIANAIDDLTDLKEKGDEHGKK